METAATYSGPAISRAFNPRILIFSLVVALLLGYPLYTFFRETFNKGVADHGSYVDVDLKALGFFHFDTARGTIDDVPAKFRQLDGRRVVLEGQVFDPEEAGDRVTRFQFVYSIAKCCFGVPQVQERVFVTVPGGRSLERSDYARLTGVLHVKISRDEVGQVSSVYTLDAERLDPIN